MEVQFRKMLTIAVASVIVVSVFLTMITAPTKILGGLYRGFMDAPEESNIFERCGSAAKSFDTRMNLYIVIHDISIHAYGGVQRALHRSLIDDPDEYYEVLKLNNGYLTFKNTSFYDMTLLKEYLLKLKSICDSVDCHLLFINKPSKDTTDKALLPLFYPYSTGSNFEDIKNQLKLSGITVMDLEGLIELKKIDKYSLFYRTDHHWKPQAGLWMSKEIADLANQEYGWQLETELLDLEQYQTRNYPHSFLGSQGKRVGALYAGTDDFDVVKPRFDTLYTVEYSDFETKLVGDFDSTMLFEENITPENLLNQNATAYATYMGGNHPLIRIHNDKFENGKKALIIMDSYGCVVAPYLSVIFEQIDCIDIRSYVGSLESYIKDNRPDVVIYSIVSFPNNE